MLYRGLIKDHLTKIDLAKYQNRTRINEQIRAPEVRVVTSEGENLGVLSVDEAIEHARDRGLDLIEISPNANPPVAKIMDYGKYKYEESKKEKERKAKATTTETKEIQVKLNTGDHDLELKAKRASEWLARGDRVKIELFLRGRSKYLEKEFLEERLKRPLKLLTVDYKIAEEPRKGPKGPYLIIERTK